MFTAVGKYFSPCVNQTGELCLVQIFKPLHILLSALGLFPQAVEFPDGKPITSVAIKKCRINSISTFLVFTIIHLFLIVHLVELKFEVESNSFTEDEMTTVTYIIDLIAPVFFCTVSYFHVVRHRILYVNILNEMAHCWNKISKIERTSILGRLRVQVNCAILGFIVITAFLLLAATFTGDDSIWKMILLSLTFVLPEIIQFTVIAFYFTIVLMIEALLKNIEEQFGSVFGLEKIKAQNDFTRIDPGLDRAMADMREMYVTTVKIKRQINRAFQGPILLALLVSFFELITLAHFIYHGLRFQSTFSTHDVVECSCWLFNQLLKMHTLTHSGTLLKSQVNKIGRTIHSFPTTDDLKTLLQIQHFSSLMTFHDIEITVYGYFPLDATLMYNIIASAAMYLIILVQFDKSP